jgi:transposase-like protein
LLYGRVINIRMDLSLVYREFPELHNCINYLEKVIWNNKPTCPYCKSTYQTPMPKERRYHCNMCNTSFSVLVGTIFENSKLDFQKWFLAIYLVINARKGISARKLAKEIEVTKDTALRMHMRIKKGMQENVELITGIKAYIYLLDNK